MGGVVVVLVLNAVVERISVIISESFFCVGGKPNFFHHPEDNKNALHVAAEGGYTDIVELLLANGALVDAVAITSKATALNLAAQNGHTRVCRLLLSRGADVNHKNGYGNTPLHSAVRNGSADCVDALLAAGAIVDAVNNKGLPMFVFLGFV
jgi:ankyrin repeat protein